MFIISVCHMKPEIVSYSLARFLLTSGWEAESFDWVLVNNHWPVDSVTSNSALKEIVRMAPHGKWISPERNLGGAGGVNFALKYIGQWAPQDHDLVLTYDPDSNPIHKGWLKAMRIVMKEDPELTHVSLLHEHIAKRNWNERIVAGHKLVSLSGPEMFNVTMWRYGFIKQGLKQGRPFWGFVESEMHKEKKSNHAYLYDFREDVCPVPHDQRYKDWKTHHAGGSYLKNFDQYILEKT